MFISGLLALGLWTRYLSIGCGGGKPGVEDEEFLVALSGVRGLFRLATAVDSFESR